MNLTVQSENGDAVLIRIEGRVSQDSSGVNWLLVAQKRIHEQGGKLVLHSLSPIANNVLKVLNLHSVFQVAESEAAALRMLGGDA
jgi:anti-anti-sigma factor